MFLAGTQGQSKQCQISQPGQTEDSPIYTAMLFSCEASTFRENVVLPLAHGALSRCCKQKLLKRMWKEDLPLAQLQALKGIEVVCTYPFPLLLTGCTTVVW